MAMRKMLKAAGLALLAAGALALGVTSQAAGVGTRSSSATCKDPTAQPPQKAGSNHLDGVAAISGCTAWAVGYHQLAGAAPFDSTLVEYWNGVAWKRQPSPNPGTDYNFLNGVAATSSNNVWAVGCYDNGGAEQPLVEHWDGSAWQVQPSPDPGGSTSSSCLDAVAATSSTNAWAVGYYDNGGLKTLVLHWDGSTWQPQPSPDLGVGGLNELFGVSATSSNNAWAVGYYDDGGATQTLIERWDGTSWTVETSPNVGGPDYNNELLGVASTSPTNAWAVGKYRTRHGNHTLVERWDGTAWQVQPSPNSGGFNQLSGVAATSSTNAWAVGFYDNGDVPFHTLTEHWNGTVWKVKPSPDPGSEYNYLNGVAATSSSNAWAVGYFNNFGGLDRSIALHWNGTAWRP